LAVLAKAVAKAERAEKAKGAKAKESSLPLWYYDVGTDQPLLSVGVARTLAAQVTLAMLAPEQERRLEEEAEASNRLIARRNVRNVFGAVRFAHTGVSGTSVSVRHEFCVVVRVDLLKALSHYRM
jgi:hypothetical protein